MRSTFLHLINKIYKILPLYEENNPNLQQYIDSLIIQFTGMQDFEELLIPEPRLFSILAILTYLRNNEYDHETCKRETFRCTNILKEIIVKYYGE